MIQAHQLKPVTALPSVAKPVAQATAANPHTARRTEHSLLLTMDYDSIVVLWTINYGLIVVLALLHLLHLAPPAARRKTKPVNT